MEFDPNQGTELEFDLARESMNPFEAQQNIKYSKNGIIRFIEETQEIENPKQNEQWDQIADFKNLNLYFKKG